MNKIDISPISPERNEKLILPQTISVKSITQSKKIISKKPKEIQFDELNKKNAKIPKKILPSTQKTNRAFLFIKKFSLIFSNVCCFFCDIWGNKKKRNETLKKIYSKHYKLSILNFFTHLVWVLRAIKTFKNRTKYRNLRDNEKNVANFVNDVVVFEENKRNHQRNWMIRMNFFSRMFKGNKSIRRQIRKIMKKIWHKKGIILKESETINLFFNT